MITTQNSAPPKSSLITGRMKLFLRRRLLDFLAHPPEGQTASSARKARQALAKLDRNRYGICEKCGYPIDLGRLLTDPTVENCVCCDYQMNCPTGHLHYPH